MNRFLKARTIGWIVLLLVAGVIVQQVWHWEVERVEVSAGEFLVLVHRWGTDLPEDVIVAPDDSYKGVLLEVRSEGRHFINPLFRSYEVHPLVAVPAGKCLVLTRKYGKEISRARQESGDILAHVGFPVPEQLLGTEEKGVLRGYLAPGSYRINPYAYSWEFVSAVEVGVHQVGVRTLKVGKDPRTLPPDPKRSVYVVPEGYRGVQQTPMPPGTYYFNRYEETITPVEADRSHRVELADIEFPSRDGFILKPHVLVEYALMAERAPEALVRLSEDENLLHQEDETPAQQQKNEILQKVILPHIRGYARIEGSNFDAKDFIATTPGKGEELVGNNREKLQKALLAKIKPRCEELGVRVRTVSLADLKPPAELADQIYLREVARVEQDRNRAKLEQIKAEQVLKATEALNEQEKQKVVADTRLAIAKTDADRRKQTEESKLQNELSNAQLQLESAKEQAKAEISRGKGEAVVIDLDNKAEVAGLTRAVQSFPSANHFAQYHMLMRLGPALTEIFASDDSEFAKLFAAYMTPPTQASADRPPAVSRGPEPLRPTAGNGGAASKAVDSTIRTALATPRVLTAPPPTLSAESLMVLQFVPQAPFPGNLPWAALLLRGPKESGR